MGYNEAEVYIPVLIHKSEILKVYTFWHISRMTDDELGEMKMNETAVMGTNVTVHYSNEHPQLKGPVVQNFVS